MKKILANENRPLTDEQKKEMEQKLTVNFQNMLEIMGFDYENDPNLKDTPSRLAKMYSHEVLTGCFNAAPPITKFPNTKDYDQIITLTNITVKSQCSHHWKDITGVCHIGYIADKEVIGLSKLSRIVDFFSRRPQIQEELTQQIADYLEKLLSPKGTIVVIKSTHGCLSHRGMEEPNAEMITSAVRGYFLTNPSTKQEFFELIRK